MQCVYDERRRGANRFIVDLHGWRWQGEQV